jgi:hypothetical protein
MLTLDHLPFPGPDLAATAAAFAALGFTVTPPCAYISPDYPDALWNNRSVFLRRGWFDLLHTPQAPADTLVGPRGALFLTNDLDAASARFDGMRLHPAYRLDRSWDGAPELGTETFRLFSIRERISPLGLAVIEHHYPCPDTRPEWFEHPNRALELAGLIFAGGEPGAFAPAAGRVLDLSGFEHWPADVFAQRFGDADLAVKVRTASLAAVRRALAPDLPVMETAGALCVRPPAPLDCGFLFLEI